MRSYGQERLERGAFYRADVIVANSEAVKDYLVSRSISSDKIKVIYNGVELERFADAADDRADICRRFGLPDGENIRFITLVANLRHAVKNVPMFLRVAKRVVKKIPTEHFVIAGEGELEQELKTLAKKMDLSANTHFIGRCTNITALLSVSDVCVLTSTAEGFSNSILEYMAAGKPVVATNVGGAAEAVMNGETGYLVASDDDEAMAGRLIELLENEEKASNFGAHGKRIVREKFSPATQIAKTVELYSALLANGGK